MNLRMARPKSVWTSLRDWARPRIAEPWDKRTIDAMKAQERSASQEVQVQLSAGKIMYTIFYNAKYRFFMSLTMGLCLYQSVRALIGTRRVVPHYSTCVCVCVLISCYERLLYTMKMVNRQFLKQLFVCVRTLINIGNIIWHSWFLLLRGCIVENITMIIDQF